MIRHFLGRTKKKKLFFVASLSLLFAFPVSSLYSNRVSFNKKVKSFRDLEKRINTEQQGVRINSSIFIKDLDSPDFKLFVGEDEAFIAASIIKIPVAAVAFKAVEEGKLSLSEKVTIKRKDIAGGSGILKAKKLPLKLTVREVLELMISRSDNTATNKMIDLLGYDYIDESFQELGLKKTILKRKMMDFSLRRKGVENYTSVSDICLLLEKIYNNEFINEEASRIMLSFLENQKVKDRLPRYLPDKIRVAHKTGLEKGVVHDAGIVFSPKGNYIICVFTKNAGSFSRAKKFIAKVSLLTYNFYR
jgi:beta-lactamase class A